MKVIETNQLCLFDFKDTKVNYKFQTQLEKIFFSLSPNKLDIEAIKTARPKNILVSYATWKDKEKKYTIKDFINELNYRPNIILDSGAFSFRDEIALFGSFKEVFIRELKLMYKEMFIEEYENEDFDTEYYESVYGIIFDKDGEVTITDEAIENELIELIDNNSYMNTRMDKYTNLMDYLLFIDRNRESIDFIISLDDIYCIFVKKIKPFKKSLFKISMKISLIENYVNRHKV